MNISKEETFPLVLKMGKQDCLGKLPRLRQHLKNLCTKSKLEEIVELLQGIISSQSWDLLDVHHILCQHWNRTIGRSLLLICKDIVSHDKPLEIQLRYRDREWIKNFGIVLRESEESSDNQWYINLPTENSTSAVDNASQSRIAAKEIPPQLQAMIHTSVTYPIHLPEAESGNYTPCDSWWLSPGDVRELMTKENFNRTKRDHSNSSSQKLQLLNDRPCHPSYFNLQSVLSIFLIIVLTLIILCLVQTFQIIKKKCHCKTSLCRILWCGHKCCKSQPKERTPKKAPRNSIYLDQRDEENLRIRQ